MCAEIIVTTRDARDLITRPGNPHMIWDGVTVRVIPAAWYLAQHRTAGWQLITSRADLIETDPGAAAYEPAFLATLLTSFASDLAAGWPCECGATAS
jgi:hypothetical protein